MPKNSTKEYMIKFYKASICDYKGNIVLTLENYCHNSRMAAAIALKYIDNCPPAQSFKIQIILFHPKDLACILTKRG
tara:strand:+ start:84 stop:314 length:231 start_codon:yes stop_codon:yes gene_type:complete